MAYNLLTPALNVFEHMALDETLAAEALPGPVLRFYHWTDGPAVTFGYSQFYAFVRRQTTPQAGSLCRRPTGGGMVLHGKDLTFSLVFQSPLTSPKDIYHALHAHIESALAQTAALYSLRQGEVPAAAYAPVQGQQASGCFVNPVQDDLLLNGQKILGGAIRRFGGTVLYQGSLQCANARSNPLFRRAVMQGVAAWLKADFTVRPVAQDLLARARQLAVQRYATTDWNEKL